MKVTNRYAAFAVHLFISAIILVLLLGVIFFIWFPNELIYAGGLNGLKILIGVDLVLGPVLTLIVFKQGKKKLKFDLTVIACIQIACLIVGLWLIYNERPRAQVLADDGIHLLAASDFKYYDIELIDLPGKSPKNIFMELPEDHQALSGIKFTSEFVEEKPFIYRNDLYTSMSEITLERFDKRIAFIMEGLKAEHVDKINQLEEHNCNWVPLHSKHNYGYACVDHTKGIMKLSNKSFSLSGN